MASQPLTAWPSVRVCIATDAVVFINLNQHIKISADVLSAWLLDILHAVPNSMLILLRNPREGEPNLRRFVSEWQSGAVSQSRLVFVDRGSPEQYLRYYAAADIFLDTFSYNAHSTGADALWMGVPLVTLPARKMCSRVGASLVTPRLRMSSACDSQPR